MPSFFQWNWLAKAKEVEAITQAPTITQPAAMVVYLPKNPQHQLHLLSQGQYQQQHLSSPMETSPDQCKKSP